MWRSHGREAALATGAWLNCCRGFAALEHGVLVVCGLMPAAIC